MNTTSAEIELGYDNRAVVAGLRCLASLGGRGVQVAPVDSDLKTQVEQDEAKHSNGPGGPCLLREDRVGLVPLLRHLVVLVHVLSKLEIEKSHRVVCEVA